MEFVISSLKQKYMIDHWQANEMKEKSFLDVALADKINFMQGVLLAVRNDSRSKRTVIVIAHRFVFLLQSDTP